MNSNEKKYSVTASVIDTLTQVLLHDRNDHIVIAPNRTSAEMQVCVYWLEHYGDEGITIDIAIHSSKSID